MPDSSPPTRSPDEQRFSIGVTSVCVTSGTLQIPFAMRDIFEPGAYPVLDVDRNETTELIFEPPRSLRGLDEIFAAHELQPNDEVILTVTSSALELEVSKRPRRKVQQAKGEPWESVSGRQSGAKDAPPGSTRTPVDGGQAPLFAAGTQREDAPPATQGEHRQEDSEAPRIVRARRVTPGEERPRMHIPGALVGSGSGASSDEPERSEEPRAKHGAKPTDASAARRFFEDPGDPEDPYAADVLADETWQFERQTAQPARGRPDESQATSGGLFAKIAQAAKGAFAFRGGAAGEQAEGADAQQDAHPREAGDRYSPRPNIARPDSTHPDSTHPDSARPEQAHDQTREAHREFDEPSVRPATGREGRAEPVQRPAPQRQESPAGPAPSSASRNVVVEDADAERMDQFGPAMWELGEGDLRSRLVRFLQHPDVPVILRTEIVARNFGLGEEVAEAMLEDLAHDKIDGLVITKVREQTYRISRAPTEL